MTPQEKSERKRLAELVLSGMPMTAADRKKAAKFITGNAHGRPRGASQKAIDQAVIYLQEYRKGGTKTAIQERAMQRFKEIHGEAQSGEAFYKNVERYKCFALMAESISTIYQREASKLHHPEE